jgi:dTDP-4-amino-4,6-dideoxygalactose transaminase
MWPRTIEQELPLAFRMRRAGPLHNARRLAALSFDLPIHQLLSGRDIRKIESIVINTLV